MSDKALGMLKHMRRQILGQPAPYVVVRGAAISIGVDPGGSECHALVEELLRRRHLQRYPSPSLTAHGLYRLTDSGISAADEADNPLRYGRVSGGRTAPPLVAESIRRIRGACRTIRLHRTRRGS
jgi:hypothetical protein